MPWIGVLSPLRALLLTLGAVPRNTARATRLAAIVLPSSGISRSMTSAVDPKPAMSASTIGFQGSSRWLVISSKTFVSSSGIDAGMISGDWSPRTPRAWTTVAIRRRTPRVR
jgi:hypothetical protein